MASNDWMPGARAMVLAMCLNWINYMTPERRTAWGIPAADFTELGNLYGAAQAILRKAMDEDERTHVVSVQCKAAFKALTAKARYFKDRFFKIPPLDEGDIAALGLRVPDPHPTPVPPPDGVPAASLSYPGGPHAMTVHLGPMAGTRELDPRSDYGYAIYMGIMPQGGATLEQAASKKHYLMQPPKDGEGLTHRFTRRRKEKIIFDAEDAGMTVYICCRYENQKGEAGKEWGPVVSAIIP
jgi:hypothetical protein